MTSPRDDRNRPNESGNRDEYRDGDDMRDPAPDPDGIDRTKPRDD